jgi:hypothetical protein
MKRYRCRNDIVFSVPFYSSDHFCSSCLEFAGIAIKKNDKAMLANSYDPKRYNSNRMSNYRAKSKVIYKKLSTQLLTGAYAEMVEPSRYTHDKLVEKHFKASASLSIGRKIKESRIYNYKRTKEGLQYVQNIQRQVSGDETS